MAIVWQTAADQNGQSETSLLSCRLGETLERQRPDRVRFSGNIASPRVGGEHDYGPGGESEGSAGGVPATPSVDRINRYATTRIESR